MMNNNPIAAQRFITEVEMNRGHVSPLPVKDGKLATAFNEAGGLENLLDNKLEPLIAPEA